jgi:hypothetical protein
MEWLALADPAVEEESFGEERHLRVPVPDVRGRGARDRRHEPAVRLGGVHHPVVGAVGERPRP